MTRQHLRTKTALVAALAVAALGWPAPPASAGHHSADCGFKAVQQAGLTGTAWEGVLSGYIVAAPGESASISCGIRVNGTTVAGTPTGSGSGTAFVAGRVTFEAADDDVVESCTSVTYGGTVSPETCERSTHTQVPPREVMDLIDWLIMEPGPFPGGLDPVVCPVLAAAAGSYGPFVVNSHGDIYLAGEPQWDCPPYDIEWS